MSRALWFVAGAASSAFVVVRGREYARRLTPEGMVEEIERRAEVTAEKTKHWWGDFAETYARARRAKHSELMGYLTQDERRALD